MALLLPLLLEHLLYILAEKTKQRPLVAISIHLINNTTMKRMILFLSLVLTIVGAMAVSGCNSCAKSEKQDIQPVSLFHDYDGMVQDFTVGVSHIQALHRQTMFSLIDGQEYQWRNSRVILNDTVTMENIDDLHVVAVNDVFFYWDSQKGPMVQYINSHVKYGVQIPYPINDVWIEDADMSEQPIKLSAEQALSRLKEYNGILPKDCNFLTLRYPVGPEDCNVQWVFGDVYDVLFIDAVTGEIRDYDPSFSRQ